MVMDYTNQARQDSQIGSDYISYAFSAHHEWLQLGVNLFQRELATSQKIAQSRDLGQAIGAWTDLMKDTVEDFSAATARLLDKASSVGFAVARNTEEKFGATTDLAERTSETATDQRQEGARKSQAA